jgi:Ca-activated chloride channel family protein
MRLAEPGWLTLLILLPPLLWWFRRARPRLPWPTLDGFPRGGPAGFRRVSFLPGLLRGIAIAAIVVALARPQSVGGRTRIAGQGVAIVVALDHSSSMNTVDFPATSEHGPRSVSRLEAARETFIRFVEGRPEDLVGLVVFANDPDLACPPTLDHWFLVEQTRAVRPAAPDEDGTNIGDAVAWSLDALRAVTPKKKVLVLLTDGRNSPARNIGAPPLYPEAAAALASELGVTVHTIAVGNAGGLLRTREPVTRLDRVAGEVAGPDFALLERMAEAGRGRAFVAADARALERVFATIDILERSPVRGVVRTRYREEYTPWTCLALVCLAADRLLSAGRWRRLP